MFTCLHVNISTASGTLNCSKKQGHKIIYNILLEKGFRYLKKLLLHQQKKPFYKETILSLTSKNK